MRQRPLKSLVSAARRITSENTGNRLKKATSNAGWQDDAWDLYDLVGEHRFLTTNIANRIGQARLYVGKRPESSVDPVVAVEEGPAFDAFESFGGSSSARTQMLTRMGQNLFVAGDGWFVGVPPERSEEGIDPLGAELSDFHWYMLSSSEVKFEQSGKVKISVPECPDPVSPDSLLLVKVWRPHPRNWEDSDSPTRSSLPVLRELVGLTMHVSAQVDSRLAGAGLLVVPQSASDAIKAAAGADTDDAEDPFTESLIDAMVTPIKDRSNASAVVPLTVTVPDEAAEKFQYISFSTPLDAEARELRDEALRRLALGADAPPELLLGTGGMNHWGAWLVREDVISSHIEPPLALVCDALTTQYLWPVLEQAGVEDAQDYVVWYDVEHMILRPNRTSDAFTLHERGVIDDEAVRDVAGFAEEDAPDQTDPVIRQVLEIVSAAPSLAQDPGLLVLADQIRALYESDEPAPPPNAPSEEEPSGPLPQTDQDPADPGPPPSERG